MTCLEQSQETLFESQVISLELLVIVDHSHVNVSLLVHLEGDDIGTQLVVEFNFQTLGVPARSKRLLYGFLMPA
jgi:hypothetical protein